MADAEIEIIISAVDKISTELQNIQGIIKKFAKESQQQTDNLSGSFKKNTDTLIAIGNAAQSVDNIFSSLTNLQLRLENATERVTGAQERFADAQDRLNDLMSSGTASAKDIAKAQEEVHRANRALTISQNNLARAQNQVIGTYINIGIQVITLSKSLPFLGAQLSLVAKEFIGVQIAATSAATALGLVFGAIGIGLIVIQKSKSEYTEFKELITELAEAQSKFADENNRTALAIDNVKKSMMGLLGPQTQEEAQMIFDIETLKQKIADLRAGIITPQEAGGSIQFFEAKLTLLQNKYDALFTQQRNVMSSYINLLSIQNQTEQGLLDETNNFWKMSLEDRLNFIKNEYSKGIIEESAKIRDEELKNIELINKKLKQNLFLRALISLSKFGTFKGQPQIINLNQIMSALTAQLRGTGIEDAIIRPDGSIIRTDPRDTLIAMKDIETSRAGLSGGIHIEINGPVYGVNPKEISRALLIELGRKLNI